MSDPVAEMLDRVSWIEWDDKLRLFHGLCDYLGEQATLQHTVMRFGNDAAVITRRLERLHWEDAWFSFEESHLRRLFDLLSVDCVFDVGANEGQYAERLRNKVGYAGPIVSFEPVPELARRLLVKAEGDPRWFIEQTALDGVEGESPFNVMASSEFSSLLNPTHEEVDRFHRLNRIEQRIVVRTSTLTSAFEKHRDRIGFQRPFLKLDTQGNDLAIIIGAPDALKQFVGLQAELSIKRIYEGAPTYLEVLEELKARGFELSALVPNNAGSFPQLVEVDCILYRQAATTR